MEEFAHPSVALSRYCTAVGLGPSRHFEVSVDIGFMAECVRLSDGGLNKNIMLIVFQPEHIVETATMLGRECR
jgi:hypothetical protein